MPLYGIDTTWTCQGYDRYIDFTEKCKALDTRWYNMLPILKYPGIIAFEVKK